MSTNTILGVSQYFNELQTALSGVDKVAIASAVKLIKECKGIVWICGNGGSAALANHFAQDLRKQCKVKAISLSANVSEITAIGNDVKFDYIYSNQLKTLANKNNNDLLIVITGSGNSPNIVNATVEAYGDYFVIGLTGFNGGIVRHSLDLEINVPSTKMGVCEDGHTTIMHSIIYQLMEVN